MTQDDKFVKANEAANEILKELEKIKNASDLVEQASKDVSSISVASSSIIENMNQLLSVIEDAFVKINSIDYESNHQELVEKIDLLQSNMSDISKDFQAGVDMILEQHEHRRRMALTTLIVIITLLILGFGVISVLVVN